MFVASALKVANIAFYFKKQKKFDLNSERKKKSSFIKQL